MNVKITTFINPFSFFCIEGDSEVTLPEINLRTNKSGLKEVTHGQYVAVLWHDQWVRGIVSMETRFQIWLVDYGIYWKPPKENMILVDLPPEEKKQPTRVFEASIHGCTPLEKKVDACEIHNKMASSWCVGAITRANNLIKKAVKLYFVPVAIMSTKCNDIVIGNLFLKMEGQNMVNLVDELEKWPVFLKKDPDNYIENLSKYHTTRRQHRGSLQKPAFAEDLPTVTPELTLSDYTAICALVPEPTLPDDTAICTVASELTLTDDESELDGSTLTYLETDVDKAAFKPTPEEINRYSNTYITIAGRKHNVLYVLLNKARDLYMCERYANRQGIGRANSRSLKF